MPFNCQTGVQVFQVNKLLSCSVPLQRETGDASKQNCVRELKGDVTDSRVSKETLFLPQLLSCHFLHYPRAPCTAAAVLPDSRRGKCDVARVGNEKNVPIVFIYLTLLREQLPLSSGRFSAAPPRAAPRCGLALRFGTAAPTVRWGCRRYARPGVAQFFEGQSHGNVEHYATLANIHSDSLPSCLCPTWQQHLAPSTTWDTRRPEA